MKKEWLKPEVTNLSIEGTEEGTTYTIVPGEACPACGGEWVWDAVTLDSSKDRPNRPGGGGNNHRPSCPIAPPNTNPIPTFS